MCLRACHYIKRIRIRGYYGPYFLGLSLSPYSVRMRETMDQSNSEYWHFLSCVCDLLHDNVVNHHEIENGNDLEQAEDLSKRRRKIYWKI